MKIPYKGYQIDVVSQKLASGMWAPSAGVAWDYQGTTTISQIYSKGPRQFKTKHEADSCALALAKVWVNHKLR